MFWNDEDLAELEGTPVVGLFIYIYCPTMSVVGEHFHIEKLGRMEAEQSYKEKLLPAIQVCQLFLNEISELMMLLESTGSFSSSADSYILLIGCVSHHG